MVHEFLKIADADLGTVPSTTCQDKQLDEGLVGYVVVLRLAAENLDHLVLLEANFLLSRILEKVDEGARPST